jgi:hypothetical protein
MMRYEIYKTKSRFFPILPNIRFRVPINHLVGNFAVLRRPILDETSWLLPVDANVWLTEHCTGLWGLYQEYYLVFGWHTGYNSVLAISDCISACNPFLGFQNCDDALLFRLSF